MTVNHYAGCWCLLFTLSPDLVDLACMIEMTLNVVDRIKKWNFNHLFLSFIY